MSFCRTFRKNVARIECATYHERLYNACIWLKKTQFAKNFLKMPFTWACYKTRNFCGVPLLRYSAVVPCCSGFSAGVPHSVVPSFRGCSVFRRSVLPTENFINDQLIYEIIWRIPIIL